MMVGGRTHGREPQMEGYEMRTWEGMDSSRLPTSVCSLAGMGSTPFPSLAPPITLLVDGKQQTLVVCLVLDIAPPGFESPIWFSAGNGSSLDAFTYGPSPAEDGTWTRLAQLSLHSEELAAWDTLVCHTGPGAGDHSQSTQPLRLSGGDRAWAPRAAPRPLSHTLESGCGGSEHRLQAKHLGEVMPGLRAGWAQSPRVLGFATVISHSDSSSDV